MKRTTVFFALALYACVAAHSTKIDCANRCKNIQFKVAVSRRRAECMESCAMSEIVEGAYVKTILDRSGKDRDCINSCNRVRTVQRKKAACIEKCPRLDNKVHAEDNVVESFESKSTRWKGDTLGPNYDSDCVSHCYRLRMRTEDCLEGCKLHSRVGEPVITAEDYTSFARDLTSDKE